MLEPLGPLGPLEPLEPSDPLEYLDPLDLGDPAAPVPLFTLQTSYYSKLFCLKQSEIKVAIIFKNARSKHISLKHTEIMEISKMRLQNDFEPNLKNMDYS